MENEEKIVNFLIKLNFAASWIAWIGSGYILWNVMKVNSFIGIIFWFFIWFIVSGIAKKLIIALTILIMQIIDSSQSK